MAGPSSDVYSLQRQLDQERMNTPEPPTKPVTIAGLEETLAANRRSSDSRLAAILSGLSLTERANRMRVSRWNAQFSGTETRAALRALADASAFLALPAADAVATPAPAITEQRRMLTALGQYLSKTLPALPDFRAARETSYYQDRPPRQLSLATDPTSSSPLLNRPLHIISTSKIQVAYVGGQEMREKKEGFEASPAEPSRFATAGEFGPIIYGVMMDARRSSLAWKRWEPGVQGPLAVFAFDAAAEASHFSFKDPRNAHSEFLAYHGEFAIDPGNGSIVRLAVMARPAVGDQTEEADIEVDYDSVEIGDHAYICPVHAVALAKVLINAKLGKQDSSATLQTEINDVDFTQYHIFRGDSRILQGFTANP